MKFLTLMIIFSALLINGCKSSPLDQLSESELKAKSAKCLANKKPSRTGAIVCANVKKECEIRSRGGKKMC